MKKITYTLAAAALIAAMTLPLTSCGGDNNTNDMGTGTDGRDTGRSTVRNTVADDSGRYSDTGNDIIEDVSDMLK